MARSKPTDTPAPSGKAGRGPAAGGRGRGSGTAKGASASGRKGDKKTGGKKPGRLKRVGTELGMIKQAYSRPRKNDPNLPWILLIAFVAVFAVVEVTAILLGSPFLFLPIAILLAALVALIIFGRRAQGTAYRQVEGQPGAASWVLEGMRGDWRGPAGGRRTPHPRPAHPVL